MLALKITLTILTALILGFVIYLVYELYCTIPKRRRRHLERILGGKKHGRRH